MTKIEVSQIEYVDVIRNYRYSLLESDEYAPEEMKGDFIAENGNNSSNQMGDNYHGNNEYSRHGTAAADADNHDNNEEHCDDLEKNNTNRINSRNWRSVLINLKMN